jgi:hypothetical protein
VRLGIYGARRNGGRNTPRVGARRWRQTERNAVIMAALPISIHHRLLGVRPLLHDWSKRGLKRALVGLGQLCLAHGWWRGVAAITGILRRGGLGDA